MKTQFSILITGNRLVKNCPDQVFVDMQLSTNFAASSDKNQLSVMVYKTSRLSQLPLGSQGKIKLEFDDIVVDS